MYLIKHAIGFDPLNFFNAGSNKEFANGSNNYCKTVTSKYNSN